MLGVSPAAHPTDAPDALQTVRKIRSYLESLRLLGATEVPAHHPDPESVPEEAQPADAEQLVAFQREVAVCQNCRLAGTRKTVVFGSGNPGADVMFVGEAPGAEEDRQGLPFVGAAGELLTRMIEAIGFDRDEVYIANVIKCRPPYNRDPQPGEVESCEPYLHRQIELIQPVVICTLGRFASQALLDSTESMGKLRGRLFAYRGIKLVPTYHPAALLRNPQWKRPTWEDLKKVRFEFDGMKI